MPAGSRPRGSRTGLGDLGTRPPPPPPPRPPVGGVRPASTSEPRGRALAPAVMPGPALAALLLPLLCLAAAVAGKPPRPCATPAGPGSGSSAPAQQRPSTLSTPYTPESNSGGWGLRPTRSLPLTCAPTPWAQRGVIPHSPPGPVGSRTAPRGRGLSSIRSTLSVPRCPGYSAEHRRG